MKKQLLFILLLAAILGIASAQQSPQKIIIRTYIEKTHMSPKTGTMIGFENRYLWEFGAFFQESSLMESLMSEEARADMPRHYERDFTGIYFAVPVMIRESIVIKVNVRTGVSNNENFVITPAVLAVYRPTKNLNIGLGLGSRAFRPTLMASIGLSF